MQKQRSSLTLIDGPMFANKTSTLIELIKIYVNEINPDFDLTVIKPTTDNRYAKSELVSHNGLRYPALECAPDELLILLQKEISIKGKFAHMKHKIFIDEGHFFQNLYDAVNLCLDAGIDVVVSGINIDYMMNPFQEMQKLQNIAKTHILCSAYCNECGKLARYTKIRPEVVHSNDSSVVIVGGSDKYAPYCGKKECKIWNF
jgi:thymidine kinase